MRLAAPAGTLPEPVLRINQEVARILKEPAIVKRLRELGVYADGGRTPQAVGKFFRAELQTWGRILREIGVNPE